MGSPDHRRNLWTPGLSSANAGRLCRKAFSGKVVTVTIAIKEDAIAGALARVSAALTDMRPVLATRAQALRSCDTGGRRIIAALQITALHTAALCHHIW